MRSVNWLGKLPGLKQNEVSSCRRSAKVRNEEDGLSV